MLTRPVGASSLSRWGRLGNLATHTYATHPLVYPRSNIDDEEGLLSVNYAGFTAVLVEGVKELTERCADLAARSTDTENREEQQQLQMMAAGDKDGESLTRVSGDFIERLVEIERRQDQQQLAFGESRTRLELQRSPEVAPEEGPGSGCHCGQDRRIRRLEGEVLELRRALEAFRSAQARS